jgi:hypothetical protein
MKVKICGITNLDISSGKLGHFLERVLAMVGNCLFLIYKASEGG